MWCRTCQQDVPGVKSGQPVRIHCPRCKSVIWSADKGREDPEKPKANDASSSTDQVWLCSEPTPQPLAPPLVWQRAQWLEDVERAKRLVALPTAVPDRERTERTTARAASTSPASPKETTAMSSTSESKWVATARRGLAAAGLAIGVFGGGLIGHVVWMGQSTLLPLGLICSLTGFAFTWLGLVAECDSLHDRDRQASEEVHQLQRRLSSGPLVEAFRGSGLRHIDAGHAGTDASPHVLLADLRRQLDAIAAQLADIRD